MKNRAEIMQVRELRRKAYQKAVAQQHLAAYVQPIAQLLEHRPAVGIVAVGDQGSPHKDNVKRGLVALNKPERTLFLKADGSVQGQTLSPAVTESQLEKLEYLQSQHGGRGLVIISGLDFRSSSGEGTPEIVDWLLRGINERTKRNSSRYIPPKVCAIGDGSSYDIPTSADYRFAPQHGFSEKISDRFALTATGKLLTHLETPLTAPPAVHSYSGIFGHDISREIPQGRMPIERATVATRGFTPQLN